jgi:hypothetical protein
MCCCSSRRAEPRGQYRKTRALALPWQPVCGARGRADAGDIGCRVFWDTHAHRADEQYGDGGDVLPIVAALAVSLGENPLLFLIPTALAANCSYMLPVGTPPNAIVFGSGHVTLPQMARAGDVAECDAGADHPWVGAAGGAVGVWHRGRGGADLGQVRAGLREVADRGKRDAHLARVPCSHEQGYAEKTNAAGRKTTRGATSRGRGRR